MNFKFSVTKSSIHAWTGFSGIFLVSLFFIFPLLAQSQNYFYGKVTYRIDYYDSTQQKYVATNTESIQILDSIYHRSENETKIGPQVLIKDIVQDTARLLMEVFGDKYAVFVNYGSAEQQSDQESNKREYKAQREEKKFDQFTGKHYTYQESEKTLSVYMSNGIDGSYSDVFNDLEGFPLQYTLIKRGMLIRYTCTKIDKKDPNDVLFKVPADYEKISMKKFYEKIRQ